MGNDVILKVSIKDHERNDILWECHHGVAGGHYGGKAKTHKILQVGLWWPTVFKYGKEYVKSCAVYQLVGKTSRRD